MRSVQRQDPQGTRTSPAGRRVAEPPILGLQRRVGNRAVAAMVADAGGDTRTLARLKYKKDWMDKAVGGVIKDMALKTTYGSGSERRTINTPTAGIGTGRGTPFSAVRDAAVPNGRHTLRGRVYYPQRNVGKFAERTILFFSGSGGSAEDYSLPIAEYYCANGATLVAINYRGFGGSTYKGSFGRTKKAGRHDLDEATFASDAHAIFAWTLQHVQDDPAYILVMGYSLGGPVAATLVDELAQAGTNVGGLILHSSLDSIRAQAIRSAGDYGGNVGADAVNNAMNVPDRLRSLGQLNPDLPVMMMSGSGADEHLDLGTTNLATLAHRAGLRNFFFGQGQGGHMETGKHFQGSALSGLSDFAKKI